MQEESILESLDTCVNYQLPVSYCTCTVFVLHAFQVNYNALHTCTCTLFVIINSLKKLSIASLLLANLRSLPCCLSLQDVTTFINIPGSTEPPTTPAHD